MEHSTRLNGYVFVFDVFGVGVFDNAFSFVLVAGLCHLNLLTASFIE
jgi:hypothetical protein